MTLITDSLSHDCAVHCDSNRLLWLDMARTASLGGMIVFHLFRDMEMFGIVPSGTTLEGGWALFARFVAGSFLVLSGISLVLSHSNGFRPASWARRLAIIAAAATLVSVVTRLGVPDAWIQFGILHAIAASSIVGLLFLRLSVLVCGTAAFAVILVSVFWGRSLDLPSWMAWTGLSATVPPALDYIPIVPWLAPFLFGMALAKAIDPARLEPRWSARLPRILTLPGQHSLLVYLVHQPVLIAVLAVFTRFLE